MRKLGARYIVGIDLLSDVVRKQLVDDLPTSRKILWDKFRPKKQQKYRRLPSLPGTLLTASVVTSMARQKKLREHVDILFQPNTRGVGLLDWHKFDLIVERAKHDARTQLQTVDKDILKRFRG